MQNERIQAFSGVNLGADWPWLPTGKNLVREGEVVQGELLVSKTFPLSIAENQLTINLVALKPIFFKKIFSFIVRGLTVLSQSSLL